MIKRFLHYILFIEIIQGIVSDREAFNPKEADYVPISP